MNMTYFFKESNAREEYQNSFNLNNYFKSSNNSTLSHFNKNFEYVVVWYNKEFIAHSYADESATYIKVVFANLTQPMYTKEELGKNVEKASYLILEIPINYIHKLPFGSIWKGGKSKERFILQTYEIQINDNYIIHSFAKAFYDMNHSREEDKITELPFDKNLYFDKVYNCDKNQLLNINYKEQSFIIHPLTLFITHYGYSIDIKRIISRHSIGEIRKRLIIEDEGVDKRMKERGIEQYVILPLNFTQRDSVFLHQLKYNQNVWKKVEEIHNKIQMSKGRSIDEFKDKTTNEVNVSIDFWHKPLTVRLKGISLGNKILCANIMGMGEPYIDPVKFVTKPKRKVKANESQNAAEALNVREYIAPENIEEIDFTSDPVNNLGTLLMFEMLERVGNVVIIDKVVDNIEPRSIDKNTRFIKDEMPEGFGIGDRHGRGHVGLANAFFDLEEVFDSESRFNKVWEYAKSFAEQNNGIARWFTFGKGFQSVDKIYTMSLDYLLKSGNGSKLPEHVLVIEIQVEQNKYYILEFGEIKKGKDGSLKGFNGIAYIANDEEEFLSENGALIKILVRVVNLKGTLNSKFPIVYDGKLALFKHHDRGDGNWVENGIKNLS